MNRLVAVLLCGLLGSACDAGESRDDEAGVPDVTVRDSAGVRIVDSGAPARSGLRVSEPAFTVGWAEGDPNFTWIQSGTILPDGGALVGDFAEGTVYRIGPAGQVRASWGRKGQGPGEYEALDAIIPAGDSVFISDARQRRVTAVSLGRRADRHAAHAG